MKRFLQRIILVLLVLTGLSAQAYDFEKDGIYYNITSMANLEVEVTYYELDYNTGVNKTPYPAVVTIPSNVNYNNKTFTVTGIGESAFGARDNDNGGCKVEEVYLPNTITSVSKCAFHCCEVLKKIVFSSDLTKIGEKAFQLCVELQNFELPEGLTTIENNAFAYCKSLTSIILPSTLSSIGASAFYGCSSLLEAFFLSPTPPTLGSGVFKYCHTALECYVPNKEKYGFGVDYLSFGIHSYPYTGTSHVISWENNLHGYTCQVDDVTTETNAGTYEKMLKATYSGGIDLTVNVPYDYTILKAPLTFTVNNCQRLYGDPNPYFTSTASGFVNGEDLTNLDAHPTYTCEATQTSDAGTYRILASVDLPNYEITYIYGTLTVKKAPLVVIAKDAMRLYGDPNPQFELLYTGLKNGQTVPAWIREPQISTSAVLGSNVGTYSVTVGNAEAVNYEITQYVAGTLTISKRGLTVKANNADRYYGEPNPEFSVTYVGFVNSQNASVLQQQPTISCNATQNSDAGEYTIVPSGVEALNYAPTYENGILTVKPLVVAFKEKYSSVAYNDMKQSDTEDCFTFVPEIVGPYSQEDFNLKIYAKIPENKLADFNTDLILTQEGDFDGNYTSVRLANDVDRYVFELEKKTSSPNVVASKEKSFTTINQGDFYLEWPTQSPIEVTVGKTVDLGIYFEGGQEAEINAVYDSTFINLSYVLSDLYGAPSAVYAQGLQEGQTELSISLECKPNPFGYYNFAPSTTLSKMIKVMADAGIDNVNADSAAPMVRIQNGSIVVENKAVNDPVLVYDLQGRLLLNTAEDVICGLSPGIYILQIGVHTFKIAL